MSQTRKYAAVDMNHLPANPASRPDSHDLDRGGGQVPSPPSKAHLFRSSTVLHLLLLEQGIKQGLMHHLELLRARIAKRYLEAELSGGTTRFVTVIEFLKNMSGNKGYHLRDVCSMVTQVENLLVWLAVM